MASSNESIGPEASAPALSGLPNLIVFYDGECSFCHGSARWLLDRDPGGKLHFAPLQGDTAERLRFEFGARFPQEIDTLVLYDARGSAPAIWLRSEAFFELLRIIGGIWSGVALLRYLPLSLSNAGYGLVVRWRLQLRREPAHCTRLETSQAERLLP
jgi:predicted DCC family thiol-disulfide oxidoreductase YuxK